MPTTVATDDFNRADAATLGANWTDNPTLTGMGIASNRAEAKAGGGFCQAHRSAEAFNADQYSKATIVSADQTAITVRGSGDNFYMLYTAGSGDILFKRTPGSFTSIVNFGGGIANGDVTELQVEGTTLRAYRNGVQIGTDQSDSTHSTGKPGVFGEDPAASKLDDWEGGNMAGGAAVIARGLVNAGLVNRGLVNGGGRVN
jgi:hypothetical protein